MTHERIFSENSLFNKHGVYRVFERLKTSRWNKMLFLQIVSRGMRSHIFRNINHFFVCFVLALVIWIKYYGWTVYKGKLFRQCKVARCGCNMVFATIKDKREHYIRNATFQCKRCDFKDRISTQIAVSTRQLTLFNNEILVKVKIIASHIKIAFLLSSYKPEILTLLPVLAPGSSKLRRKQFLTQNHRILVKIT